MSTLKRLHDLILQERQAAVELDMDSLLDLVEEKRDLLSRLQGWGELSPEERELAESILRENRRNSYLFHFALSWTRENMEILQNFTSTPVYGHSGGLLDQGTEGNLLSGKV